MPAHNRIYALCLSRRATCFLALTISPSSGIFGKAGESSDSHVLLEILYNTCTIITYSCLADVSLLSIPLCVTLVWRSTPFSSWMWRSKPTALCLVDLALRQGRMNISIVTVLCNPLMHLYCRRTLKVQTIVGLVGWLFSEHSSLFSVRSVK
jgi:hypothetical protein